MHAHYKKKNANRHQMKIKSLHPPSFISNMKGLEVYQGWVKHTNLQSLYYYVLSFSFSFSFYLKYPAHGHRHWIGGYQREGGGREIEVK